MKKNRQNRPLVLAAIGASLTVALAGCSSSDSGSGSSPAPSVSGSTAKITGSDAEIAFAQLMIPHHQQAVEMADMALTPGSSASPQVKSLATSIKSAQGPEITEMTAWLNEWGAPTAMPSSTASNSDGMDMGGMDMGGMSSAGMMTSAQMTSLTKASGPTFDKMWLQMMIAHHEGAITMAQDVSANSQNPQVKALATSIETGQDSQIKTMKQLLAG